jgi:ubiquinone/menaquinone biosynthesis C-methylase UbiE
MLQAAGIRAGMRVLDVAAGTGDQTVLAAQRVGPSGSVLASDVSASMLEAAAEAARESGLHNVQTLVTDASTAEFEAEGFDAAICRFGLMFVPDVHQACARIRHALKPGARFATLVWSTEEKNPYIGLQLSLLREMDRMPSPLPSIARTVMLSAPGVLERALRDAKFEAVQVSAVDTPRVFTSVADALNTIQTASPNQGEMKQRMSPEERDYFASELQRRLHDYLQADGGCVLPGEALLGVGTR